MNLKRAAITTCQIVITLALLYWVFHDPEKRAKMADALSRANWWWLLAAFAVYGTVEAVAVVRWQLLLRVQGIYLGWLRVGGLLMIGVFFNLFMLGATGGDVVKIFYLLKETPGKRGQALLAVLMDRLIGLIALIFMSSIFVGLRFHKLTGLTLGEAWASLLALGPTGFFTELPRTGQLAMMLIFILGGALGGILISFAVTGFGLVEKLPARLPFHKTLVELSVAYNLYARAWMPSLAAFFLSLLAHGIYFVTFYLCARAFDAVSRAPSLFDMFTVMPIVNTLTALPLSVSGVGLREWLFVQLLPAMKGEVPVLISSTGFIVIAIWSLVGGVIYLIYRPSEHARLGEMESVVEAVEEKIVRTHEQ